jgi:MFS family permease
LAHPGGFPLLDLPLARTVVDRWRSNLSILAALSFLRGAHNSIYAVVWQPFFLSLGASVPMLGLLNSLGGNNGILPTIMQPIGGWFADRIGYKPFILVSSLAIIGGYFLFAAAGALYLWILAVGGILLLSISTLSRPAISSMTAESVRAERQGSAFSLIMVATTVPGIIAPTLGGWAADRFGFVAVFPLVATFEVAILLLVWRYLSETRSPNGIIHWREAASAFVRSALPPRKLYGISFAVAGDAFFWGIGWGILYGMLTQALQFRVEQLGIMSSVMSLSWAAFQMPIGRYIDKHGTRGMLILSEAVGIPLMLIWLTQSRFELFAAGQILFGLTAATWVPVVSTHLTRVVSPEERAEAFGRLNMFRGLVSFPAPAIGGLLFAWGGIQLPVLANLVGIIIVMVILALFVHEPQNNQ